MKKPAVHTSAARDYREVVRPHEGEVAFRVGVEQSDLFIVIGGASGPGAQAGRTEGIVAGGDTVKNLASTALHAVRGDIKSYILLHTEFMGSLAPVEVSASAPEVVRAMAAAGAACGVGPMAAVAGAVAQAVADVLAEMSREVLVENGGDVYLYSSRERTVGLLAEPETGARLGLRFGADAFPLAVCSSSATIGHSLSLGAGELSTVAARPVAGREDIWPGALADAAATAMGNMLATGRDVSRALNFAESLAELGVVGAFCQCGGKIGAWGMVELEAL